MRERSISLPIHPASRTRRVLATFALSIAVTAALVGCSSFGGSGPSGKSITRTAKTDSRIKLIDLTDAVAIWEAPPAALFGTSGIYNRQSPPQTVHLG